MAASTHTDTASLKTLLAGALVCALTAIQTAPAFALSELQKAQGQQQAQNSGETAPPTSPAPAQPDAPANLPQSTPLVQPGAAGTAAGAKTDDGKSVEILYDINAVPEPVRQMRQKIVEAAASGEIERLRPLLTATPPTQVTIGDTTDDPVRSLKELSGDSDGIEILAILLDVLQTGFAHIGKGTPDEMYVWPYFTEKQLTSLTAPEKVELLRIVTAGDYSDMLEFGGYNFYRVGITPKGDWKFFVAGD